MNATSKSPKAVIGAVCAVGALILLIMFFVWNRDEFARIVSNAGVQSAAAAAADLSTAGDFSVLAALSASSANNTTLSGNLGLSPGLESSRTGPWTVGGTESFGVGGASAAAQTDALNAYNNLAGQASDGVWGLDPSPLPGVWTTAESATFAGPTLTLNGDYDDVWVFQIGTDFTFTGSVVMAGNAQPCNVFWQVGRDATIAVGSSFKGTLIASRDITLVSGAVVNGQIISLNGAVTTDGNTISGPTCVTAAQAAASNSSSGSGSSGGSTSSSGSYAPVIGVQKFANPTALSAGRGTVVYEYIVSNIGKRMALVDVTLVDDKCAPVTFISGDINANKKLDIDEDWNYRCTSTLATTTTNTATATGYGDNIYHAPTVASAVATVVVGNSVTATSTSVVSTPTVTVPAFPNTGLSPEEKVPALNDVSVMSGMRLIIPKIQVDSQVESVGLTKGGAVGVPVDPMNAAWFDKGPLPGEKGNAIIDGHFGLKDSKQAVFDNLHKLNIGDKVIVENEHGIATTFVVRRLHTYSEHEIAKEVFISDDNGSHLNLITCGGVWDPERKTYSSRLVVFADKE